MDITFKRIMCFFRIIACCSFIALILMKLFTDINICNETIIITFAMFVISFIALFLNKK